MDRVLRERIRADGLPLPGQAAAVPDAFAIAAVLLPTVPAQPHADGPVRASRSGQTAAAARADTDTSDASVPAVDEASLITGPAGRPVSGPDRAVVAIPGRPPPWTSWTTSPPRTSWRSPRPSRSGRTGRTAGRPCWSRSPPACC